MSKKTEQAPPTPKQKKILDVLGTFFRYANNTAIDPFLNDGYGYLSSGQSLLEIVNYRQIGLPPDLGLFRDLPKKGINEYNFSMLLFFLSLEKFNLLPTTDRAFTKLKALQSEMVDLIVVLSEKDAFIDSINQIIDGEPALVHIIKSIPVLTRTEHMFPTIDVKFVEKILLPFISPAQKIQANRPENALPFLFFENIHSQFQMEHRFILFNLLLDHGLNIDVENEQGVKFLDFLAEMKKNKTFFNPTSPSARESFDTIYRDFEKKIVEKSTSAPNKKNVLKC